MWWHYCAVLFFVINYGPLIGFILPNFIYLFILESFDSGVFKNQLHSMVATYQSHHPTNHQILLNPQTSYI